jgi:hypothetical protein
MQQEEWMYEIERFRQDVARTNAELRCEGWRLVIVSAVSFFGTLAISVALLRYFDGLVCR